MSIITYLLTKHCEPLFSLWRGALQSTDDLSNKTSLI